VLEWGVILWFIVEIGGEHLLAQCLDLEITEQVGIHSPHALEFNKLHTHLHA